MRRALFALLIGLTALCVLAKPVAASGHEIHEAAHAIADAGGDIPDPDGEDGGPDPQHAEDECCFHAVALSHVETRAAIATPVVGSIGASSVTFAPRCASARAMT